MNDDVSAMVKVLREGKLLHLATSDGSTLHAAAVWYALSEDGVSLVFTSRDSRVHSVNIRDNGAMAGSVITIPLEGLGQKVQGVFMSGESVETVDADLEIAYGVYAARWPQVTNMFSADDIRSGRTPMRMYRFDVSSFVWLDEVSHPSDPKLEFTPTDLRA